MRNLLSVPKLTKANKCIVVSGPSKGAIVDGEIDLTKLKVASDIAPTGNLYTIRAKIYNNSSTANNTVISKRANASIRNYIRQTKPSRETTKRTEQQNPLYT